MDKPYSFGNDGGMLPNFLSKILGHKAPNEEELVKAAEAAATLHAALRATPPQILLQILKMLVMTDCIYADVLHATLLEAHHLQHEDSEEANLFRKLNEEMNKNDKNSR